MYKLLEICVSWSGNQKNFMLFLKVFCDFKMLLQSFPHISPDIALNVFSTWTITKIHMAVWYLWKECQDELNPKETFIKKKGTRYFYYSYAMVFPFQTTVIKPFAERNEWFFPVAPFTWLKTLGPQPLNNYHNDSQIRPYKKWIIQGLPYFFFNTKLLQCKVWGWQLVGGWRMS